MVQYNIAIRSGHKVGGTRQPPGGAGGPAAPALLRAPVISSRPRSLVNSGCQLLLQLVHVLLQDGVVGPQPLYLPELDLDHAAVVTKLPHEYLNYGVGLVQGGARRVDLVDLPLLPIFQQLRIIHLCTGIIWRPVAGIFPAHVVYLLLKEVGITFV